MSSPLQKASVRARKTAPLPALCHSRVLAHLGVSEYVKDYANCASILCTSYRRTASLLSARRCCGEIRPDRLLLGLSTPMSGLQLEPHIYAACLPSLQPSSFECIG